MDRTCIAQGPCSGAELSGATFGSHAHFRPHGNGGPTSDCPVTSTDCQAARLCRHTCHRGTFQATWAVATQQLHSVLPTLSCAET